MKIFACAIFLLIGLNCGAQWIEIESPTSLGLYDVHFPSEQIGYAVGGHPYEGDGIILKSNDGGNNWFIIDSTRSNYFFNRVFFINESIGFVTGKSFDSDPILYKTIDGGLNWEDAETPFLGIINDIGLTSEYIYVMVESILYKSIDMGETWTSSGQVGSDLVDFVSFIDPNNGFGHVADVHFDAIYKTTDAGVSWDKIEFELEITSSQQQAFVFINSELGFSGGWYQNHLMKTTDGGLNWTGLNIDNGGMPFIECITARDSVIYVGGANWPIYRSQDLGTTWTAQPLPDSLGFSNVVGLNEIAIINDSTAVGVGHFGAIIKTINSGGILGKKEENLKKKISIFPNPSANQIKIELGEAISIQSMQLINASGHEVKSYPKSQTQLDLTGLAAGVYILRIGTDQGEISKRVVVK